MEVCLGISVLSNDFGNLIPRIAVPVYFWWYEGTALKFNHGMGTAIHFNWENGLFLTCDHVLTGYEEQREKVKNCIFQIGTAIFSHPEQFVVSRNKKLDLLSLKIRPGYLKMISRGWVPEKEFYCPVAWPNRPVEKGEQVFVVGCTGDGRTFDPQKGLGFNYSSFVLNVSELLDDKFSILGENLSSIDGTMKWSDVTKLGGISGSGVFVIRNGAVEMVGVIKEGHKFDNETIILYAAYAHFLKVDGQISGN